ncbi:MAG: saccharopine dehydrogenase NADP-binding domain-containing protein [Alphaproteobacteria bacterium]|nr:saccharopine dehydrogenase NADP-binding domain-containing protein [Alphaproteobacteria bacterium]
MQFLANFRILILGASGQFGRRLCQRLVREGHLTLLLCGRDKAKLMNLQKNLRDISDAETEVVACNIDCDDFSALLLAQRPNLVVHLAGPFQNQDYKIAKACLGAGVVYIDMADGRDFVDKFQTLDAEAKEKGVSLITGASTVPALSSSILDKVQRDIPDLREVDYGISAGLKTGLGYATLKAVLSYCGKPYAVLQKTVYGLSEPRSYCFLKPVGQRSIVNCDIPDLGLFPQRYPTLTELSFASCIDVPLLAPVLALMSYVVQRKWIKDWNFLSALILPFMKAVKFLGSPHSGFFMNCAGCENGQRKRMSYEIIALNGSGLEIPVTPVVLLIKRMMKGESFPAGAYPCIGLIPLDDFERELSPFPISFHWKVMS